MKEEYKISCKELTRLLQIPYSPTELLHLFSTASKAVKCGSYTLRIKIEKSTGRYKLTLVKNKMFIKSGYCPELEEFLIKQRHANEENHKFIDNEDSFYNKIKRAAEEGRKRISLEIAEGCCEELKKDVK
jgi:hypothetical protein